jgi:hypothetical protein
MDNPKHFLVWLVIVGIMSLGISAGMIRHARHSLGPARVGYALVAVYFGASGAFVLVSLFGLASWP